MAATRMAATRRDLGKPIVNAPVASDPPRLNGIVGASNPEIVVQGFVPVFGDVGSSWLNRAQFVGAARHEHTGFSVPLPMEAKSGMRHWVGRRPKVGMVPAFAAIERYLDAADSAATRPRQAGDFVKP